MNDPNPAIAAVVGYAVGTVQILVLDWFRRRAKHRQKLRVLRAELRRLSEFTEKYAWVTGAPPPDEAIPRPPAPIASFVDLVTQTDFYLTDEHDDDNTQMALLQILDGATALEHYHNRINDNLDGIRRLPGPVAVKLWNEAVNLSQSYDAELDRVMIVINSALADVDRRLREISFWSQLNRPLGKLPKGVNPPPLPKPRRAP